MADSNELKKETVRIDLPPPTAGNTSDALRPVDQPKNNQSDISIANVGPQTSLSGIAPGEKNSMLLTWILFGASLLILIIQIWTYFS